MINIPENWIDKIFNLLNEYFGERWQIKNKKGLELDIYKTMWENGLKGLSYEQLRHGLAVSRKIARQSYAKAPTVVVFYHYCIGFAVSRRTS